MVGRRLGRAGAGRSRDRDDNRHAVFDRRHSCDALRPVCRCDWVRSGRSLGHRSNIGTATSSAMAAVGASSTAKRLAAAYIAFKLIAAAVALVLFPIVVRLMLRASGSIDPVTLLAAYHTGYNVMGVAILLPLMGPFTRMIERIVPERGSVFTRGLDPASLDSPVVAVGGSPPDGARLCSKRYVHRWPSGWRNREESRELSSLSLMPARFIGRQMALQQARAFLFEDARPTGF